MPHAFMVRASRGPSGEPANARQSRELSYRCLPPLCAPTDGTGTAGRPCTVLSTGRPAGSSPRRVEKFRSGTGIGLRGSSYTLRLLCSALTKLWWSNNYCISTGKLP